MGTRPPTSWKSTKATAIATTGLRAGARLGVDLGVQGFSMKAPILLALAPSISAAQSAEPTGTLMLACQGDKLMRSATMGTVKDTASLGIIVDLAARTVEFGIQFRYTLSVRQPSHLGMRALYRTFRAQPALCCQSASEASSTALPAIWMRPYSARNWTYSLKCKPTQWMF